MPYFSAVSFSIVSHVYELLMSDKMLSFGKAKSPVFKMDVGVSEVNFYFPKHKHTAKPETFLGTNNI